MEQYIELISVPVITGITYAVIEVLKKATNNNEKFMKFIPLISLVLGVVSGLIAYYAVPGYVEASNIWVALIIGGASGLSATGTNQVVKQLIAKSKEEKNESTKNEND